MSIPAPPIRGVLAPVVTPFTAALAPDPARLARHCRWLLDLGCDGLAVFGTNSEANSMAAEERMDLLEAIIAAGIPAGRLMPGTGCCSITETARLSAHATRLGCAGVLALPPFYYKGVPEDGLFRHFSEVIGRVGDPRLRLYLYHIPPVAVVGIAPGLIARLLDAFPGTVAGLKDSSGDWSNTGSLIRQFGPRGFDVFAGSEVFLLRTLAAGGAGCITAGANVNPHGIAAVLRAHRQGQDAPAAQEAANQVRTALQRASSMIPALKACIAHHAADPAWRTVRPPLAELAPDEAARVVADATAAGLTMPGLREGLR